MQCSSLERALSNDKNIRMSVRAANNILFNGSVDKPNTRELRPINFPKHRPSSYAAKIRVELCLVSRWQPVSSALLLLPLSIYLQNVFQRREDLSHLPPNQVQATSQPSDGRVVEATLFQKQTQHVATFCREKMILSILPFLELFEAPVDVIIVSPSACPLLHYCRCLHQALAKKRMRLWVAIQRI